MILKDIYKNDIDRDIDGVIMVQDEAKIKQELTEYVVTKELRKHFNTFLTNYENSIDRPTAKVGVWISGFFGSGKSHFLKMLSYLLSNKEVDGKKAVDYFCDKFDDPMMFSQLERCASVPTDTILFNIDSKGPINKDATAIMRVFAKVFYEYLGYFGTDLKVAKLEQFISKQNKMDEFKTEFEKINGLSWEDARVSIAFYEDDIVNVLQQVLGMSEASARNWFNGEESGELSIDQLVNEICEYINTKGEDFRLLFMVDEVGQYIGSDGNLMLNLQTIVEDLATKCHGRVWVMVTSQEAIDSITKIRGDDFSKIQDRFNTRLSLSSSSVDEVIKRRLLDKTDIAVKMLKMKYGEKDSVLKNLFTFNQAVLDLKGYESENSFVESYPFVPYQFRLTQNVLEEIRKHGHAGKNSSGGARTMLAEFQETARAIEDEDENSLVPFYRFYDPIHKSLDSTIRRVLERCQDAADNNDGINNYDVCVLKLLYLIRYIDDIKSNVDNITTLMIDGIDADKVIMRQQVQESLDRLYSQNYVSRSGDLYMFLTDEEQEIAIDIRNVPVNSSEITQKMMEIIFADLYPYKKFSRDKSVFSYDQFVDDVCSGMITGAIKLRILTVASDMYSSPDQALILQSSQNEAIIKLGDYPYFEDIENALKIRKYIKGKNVAQLPDSSQEIIKGKNLQANAFEKSAKEMIEKAIASGTVFVAGERLDSKKGSAKATVDDALSYLVDAVYSKLSFVKRYAEKDMDILNILDDKQIKTFDYKSPNKEAIDEIDSYLKLQEMKHLPTSMGDVQKHFQSIPFGWREIDIAALVAELIRNQVLQITYSGTMIQPDDRRLPDYLRKKTEIDKAIVSRRNAPPEQLIKDARMILKDYFNIMDVPQDEDGLIKFVIDSFGAQKQELKDLLNSYTNSKYPGQKIVQDGVELIDSILAQRKDNVALLSAIVSNEDNLLNLNDDLTEVRSFFKNQKSIFDEAIRASNKMEAEKEYISADKTAVEALAEINSIINMDKPYRRISELPTLIQQVDKTYDELLDIKRREVYAEIEAAQNEVVNLAGDRTEVKDPAVSAFNGKINAATGAETITQLDAMKPGIGTLKQTYIKMLLTKPEDEAGNKTNINEASRSSVLAPANLKSETDIDDYVAKLKKTLMDQLDGYDELHII